LASPQKENGYTAIANEIIEALARTRIPGEARQVLDVILRRTYGWQKKEAVITRKHFITATGLKGPNVTRGVRKLLEMNLICIKSDTQKAVSYRLNKDYESWRFVSKKIRGIKSDTNGNRKRYKQVSEVIQTIPLKASTGADSRPPKENTKEIYLKKSLTERLLKMLKRQFPGAHIPDNLPAEKVDLFLYKIERGEINPAKVNNPMAYIKSLNGEPFPSLPAREEAARKKKTEREESVRKEREELEKFRKANDEGMKQLVKSFRSELEGKSVTKF
jgi:phage replication O-like protein O